ncbi:ATP-binding protein [Streptomyces sp. NPDC056910]|uniref:ATP-binding protein n=1 Tax=Streptomyces sp. NPDC056910 TaxID=3345964 RepID=UPI0036C576B1
MPINPTKSDAIRRGGRGSTAAWEVIGVFDTDGDGECADWVFPEEPGAVRSARAAVRGQLGVWGLDSLGDVTELLVSELVTNALRHASGPIGVRLLRSAEPGHTLRVEVSDHLPDPPLERVAGPEEESGRGLQLVAGAARRWGTRPGDAGKTVWFELSLPGRY